MNMKMCLNWKVLAGLGVVAVGIFVVDPQLAARALPLLVVAICPLSMLLMGGMMMAGQNKQPAPTGQTSGAGEYTCPMHPDVRSSQSGRCPKCGMNLVLAAPALPNPASTPSGASSTMTRQEQLAVLQAQLKSVAEQQAALAKQVEQLHDAEESTSPNWTVAEAERVAQAADNRPKPRK